MSSFNSRVLLCKEFENIVPYKMLQSVQISEKIYTTLDIQSFSYGNIPLNNLQLELNKILCNKIDGWFRYIII